MADLEIGSTWVSKATGARVKLIYAAPDEVQIVFLMTDVRAAWPRSEFEAGFERAPEERQTTA